MEVYCLHPSLASSQAAIIAANPGREKNPMEDEDDLPRKVGWEPKNLEPLSIDQLEDYISVLEGEIARVRSDMETKKAKIGAAEAFFKK